MATRAAGIAIGASIVTIVTAVMNAIIALAVIIVITLKIMVYTFNLK